MEGATGQGEVKEGNGQIFTFRFILAAEVEAQRVERSRKIRAEAVTEIQAKTRARVLFRPYPKIETVTFSIPPPNFLF